MDPSIVTAARKQLGSGVADVNAAIAQLEELREGLDKEEGVGWELRQDVR
jgi:hypothetical protein